MGINGVVKPIVRKTFEFVLKDGQKIELEQDEAEEIRDFLNLELPKVTGISTLNYTKIEGKPISVQVEKPSITTRRPVPTGYTLLTKSFSQPRNGSPPLTYAYYKDAAGNFGYQIEEGSATSFFRLGKISDPLSTIGRFLRKIPTDAYLSKTTMQKEKIFSNTQTMKALLDILEMEKCIEREAVFDGRGRSAYRRIVKLEESRPEVENNHGLVQASVSSGPKVGVYP